MSSFTRTAIWAFPVCFTAGFLISDYFETSAEESRVLSMRVSQRLGKWVPPDLLPGERKTLMNERDRVIQSIAKLEKRMESSRPTNPTPRKIS